MAGGLIQIAMYGSQDLFLTGVPEITFFKVVYRRHTNFAMESIRVLFDNSVSFNSTSFVTLPRVGDLAFKTYVEVQLPAINLQRQTKPDPVPFELSLIKARAEYQIVTDFMTVNRNAYVSAYDIYIAENNIENATSDMINAINDVFSAPGNQEKITKFETLLTLTPTAPFTYDEVSMQSIANSFSPTSDKNDLFFALNVGIDKSIKTQNFFFQNLKTARQNLADALDNNIKFAWVQRIGHAIMESIDLRIGGQKVDRHFGDWLNIWYELTAKRDMEPIYFKMIGNVSDLTSFDRTIKPAYLLKIPLQFWFCRYSGLALPLVALQYHDVTINIKFRNFNELCYIEPGTNIKYQNIDGGITLAEVPEVTGTDINAFLLVDYVYLDSSERRRFAQSSHEYLIDELQVLGQDGVTVQELPFLINNFVHPSKELIWVSQKSSYTKNITGTNQCRWDNYSLTIENEGNPIIFSSLDFNSYNRVTKLDGNYFNYVQPYETHWTTPSDGVNMYSFSLFPEEQQPSGAANLSRFVRIVLTMTFGYTQAELLQDPINVRVYTRSINVLRILSGMAGLSFVYG